MSIDQKTKLFFPNLDGLRFIAFSFVFSEHVIWGAVRLLEIKQPLLLHVLYSILCDGGLGVSIFFVLSGFLITYLILSEIELTGKINVKAFYIRRFLRIWPLYFAVLLFVFFIYPFVQSLFDIYLEVGTRKIFYFTFLSNFDLIHLGQNHLPGSLLSGVTWSVAIEEQFYLLWPLLFFLIPSRYFIYVFPPFILISLIFRFYFYDDPYMLYFHSWSICSDLAVGGLTAYTALKYSKFRTLFESTENRNRMIMYFSGVLFLLLNGYYLNFKYSVLFNRLLPSLFFAWVIMDQNFNKNAMFKLSNYKWISNWGKYTYGLYLLHPLAFLIITTIIKHYDINDKTFILAMIKALITFVLTCFISYFSYHWFEKYFLRLKSKFAYFTKD